MENQYETRLFFILNGQDLEELWLHLHAFFSYIAIKISIVA
jgi:hypothetical protein